MEPWRGDDLGRDALPGEVPGGDVHVLWWRSGARRRGGSGGACFGRAHDHGAAADAQVERLVKVAGLLAQDVEADDPDRGRAVLHVAGHVAGPDGDEPEAGPRGRRPPASGCRSTNASGRRRPPARRGQRPPPAGRPLGTATVISSCLRRLRGRPGSLASRLHPPDPRPQGRELLFDPPRTRGRGW